MKTKLVTHSLIALFSAGASTAVLAHEDYSEAGSIHWLQHVSQSKAQPDERQRAPYGYATTGGAGRVVDIADDTRRLDVTRLETVQIRSAGKSVTWVFDTLGTAPFPLDKIVPGTGNVTVYVAENPSSRG